MRRLVISSRTYFYTNNFEMMIIVYVRTALNTCRRENISNGYLSTSARFLVAVSLYFSRNVISVAYVSGCVRCQRICISQFSDFPYNFREFRRGFFHIHFLHTHLPKLMYSSSISVVTLPYMAIFSRLIH